MFISIAAEKLDCDNTMQCNTWNLQCHI